MARKAAQPKADEQLIEQKIMLAQIARPAVRESYYTYVKIVNSSINEDADYKESPHLEYLCNELQKFLTTNTGNAYDLMVVNMPSQHGKALESETPVLTTKGWKRHKDLSVGDYVYGADGKQKRVLHTQESYVHDCVRVTLDTGESFICAKEHEWVVECARDRRVNGKRVLDRKTEILEAQHIFNGYHANSPAIKTAKPLQNKPSDLPIDPYVLGIWLGDGCTKATHITCHPDDCGEYAEYLDGIGVPYKIRHDSGNNKLINLGVTSGRFGSNSIRNELKALGVWGNKHIPEIYLHASEEQRLKLLQGLMDTDGCVSKTGNICEFSNTNKAVSDGTAFLIRSLGFKCATYERDAKLNGRFISKFYRTQFTPTKGMKLFNLTRKQERVNNKTKPNRKDRFLYFIKSIESVGPHEVKCITVEDGIYLVGYGLVQTHNSMTLTETLPSWYLGMNPDASVIVLAYGDDLAQRFGRRNREKIEQYGGLLFDMNVSRTKFANDDFEIAGRRGRMITRGIMSGVTGNPAKLMIIDDPIRTREEAYSAVSREKLWQEWLSSLKTRLASGAKVILVSTRFHEDDLAGRILKSERNVTHINLTAEAEPGDVLGRKPGEGLFPAIGKGTAWVQQMKRAYIAGEGLEAWNAIFQGRPTIQSGNIFKRNWFKFYDDLPPLYYKLISVDAAFKDTKSSDFVAIGVWGKSGPNVYLIDLINERLDFVRTLETIQMLKARHEDANMVLIEDKANGSAIISTLRRDVMGVVPVEPLGSKEARAYAIQPFLMAGNVYLPKNEPWTEDYIDQMTRFPKARYDDMVDMTSQALIRLKDFHADPLKPPPAKPPFNVLQKPNTVLRELTGGNVSNSFVKY